MSIGSEVRPEDEDETAELHLLLDQPLRPPLLARITSGDRLDTLAAVLISAAPTYLLREVLGWQGYLGTGVWWYVLFLLTYFLLQRSSQSAEIGVDRVISVIMWSVALAVLAVLVWMLGYVVVKGIGTLSLSYFFHDMTGVGPLNKGGGALAAIVGTGEQVGMATVIVVPLAILTAVYLNEIQGRLSNLVRFVVNALAGLPSIVAGLIVYSVWVAAGHGFSGAAGSAALVILMLPTVTRTSEEVLRIVPDPLREASLALGAPQWRVVARVVLPTALAGLTTAVILGIALGIGETAPLLLTTSSSTAVNWNPFHGPQSSLTVFIKTYVLLPNGPSKARGFATALVLLILVGALFALARYFAGRSARRLGRRS